MKPIPFTDGQRVYLVSWGPERTKPVVRHGVVYIAKTAKRTHRRIKSPWRFTPKATIAQWDATMEGAVLKEMRRAITRSISGRSWERVVKDPIVCLNQLNQLSRLLKKVRRVS